MCSRTGAGGVFHALVSERTHIETFQQVFAFAKQDGRQRQVQLVDQTGAEILPNSGDTAADADVLAARDGFCLLECGVNAAVTKKNSVPPAIFTGARA